MISLTKVIDQFDEHGCKISVNVRNINYIEYKSSTMVRLYFCDGKSICVKGDIIDLSNKFSNILCP